MRSLRDLKVFAAVAIVCAAAILLARPKRVSSRQAPDERAPVASWLAAARRRASLFSAFVALPAFVILFAAAIGAGETPGGAPAGAGTVSQLQFVTAGEASAAGPGAAAPYEPAPEGANPYWYARAYEIAEMHHLGRVFVRQMMQESGFADDVISGQTVSWAGAQGIAQIMLSHHPYADPLNPEKALRYAARHMLDLLVWFDGSISKALAAYNAGGGTVLDALATHGSNWVQALPEETQHYLAMILVPGESDLIKNWPQLKAWWAGASETLKPHFRMRLTAG